MEIYFITFFIILAVVFIVNIVLDILIYKHHKQLIKRNQDLTNEKKNISDSEHASTFIEIEDIIEHEDGSATICANMSTNMCEQLAKIGFLKILEEYASEAKNEEEKF